MLVLSIRTDNPKAEVGLYKDSQKIGYKSWQAHRKLAETIHQSISEILISNGKNISDINGVVVFQGPGSFTGLRIGISVANALGNGLGVPIAGASGRNWQKSAIKNIGAKKLVWPNYGLDPYITIQKK